MRKSQTGRERRDRGGISRRSGRNEGGSGAVPISSTHSLTACIRDEARPVSFSAMSRPLADHIAIHAEFMKCLSSDMDMDSESFNSAAAKRKSEIVAAIRCAGQLPVAQSTKAMQLLETSRFPKEMISELKEMIAGKTEEPNVKHGGGGGGSGGGLELSEPVLTSGKRHGCQGTFAPCLSPIPLVVWFERRDGKVPDSSGHRYRHIITSSTT